MKIYKFLIASSLLYIFFTSNVLGIQVDAENISSDKYFEATLKEITEAKSTITVAMYLISSLPDQPNSQPNQLLNALIKAKDRGVAVKVILDQNINFESESSEDAVTSNKNQQAYEFLKKNNVPVFFDTSDIYTHSKAIIIDDETVILGSTNWSKAALTRNNEANALIRSKEFASNLLNDLNQIKLQENIPQVLTPKVSIPLSIIQDKELLSQMASTSDERAFDTYLYLLKEYDTNKDQTVTLDYDALAKSLNIHHMSPEDYRRQITKVLEKLEKKYRLLSFEKPSRNQNASIKLILKPQTNNLNIPATFWRHRWNQTLSFPAKVMYLINLSYTQASPEGRFSVSRETLSKTHGVSESFISEGNQHLRKLNLLNIQYSDLEDKNYNQRQPSTYSLNDLYNPEDIKQQLNKLGTKHGQDKLTRALTTAQAVFEENNIKTIETLIDLENKYGQQTIQEALNKIKEKNTDNPKRSAGYLINTIKDMGKK